MFRLICFLSTCLILLTQEMVSGQVAHTLYCFPRHLQFYARNDSGTAPLCISGKVDSTGYDSLVCEVYKDSVLYSKSLRLLTYINKSAPFNFSPSISASLSEYYIYLKIYKQGKATLLNYADSLVCGDVYIISGQSNSCPTDAQATWQNEYCRTFGILTKLQNTTDYNPSDTLWGLANGHGFGEPFAGKFSVGVWGLQLMRQIYENEKIPVCIINGGVGGSSIEYHLPANDRLSIKTAYGRLNFRMQKSGLQKNVKALFWYQGESNSGSSYTKYAQNFDSLYNNWNRDFSIKNNIYVFQIHHGCGDDNQHLLREVQRNLSRKYNKVKILSTNGFGGFTGCHYKKSGYDEIGNYIYKVLQKDIYKYSVSDQIFPPDLQKAWFMPGHMEARFYFDTAQRLVWPADSAGYSLYNYFFFDTINPLIDSFYINKNELRLYFHSPVYAKTFTYLPIKNYTGTLQAYNGPYLKNELGVAALSVGEFPIQNAPPPVAKFRLSANTVCQNARIHFYEESLYQPTQWFWELPGAEPSYSIDSSPDVVYKTPGYHSIKLIARNIYGMDSITMQNCIYVHPLSKVSAGDNVTICPGDSVQLNGAGGKSCTWLPTEGLSDPFSFTPFAHPACHTNYILFASDSNNCINSDTIKVLICNIPEVSAGNDTVACEKGNSVQLQGYPQQGFWRGQGIVNNQFFPDTVGIYKLYYNYFNICLQTDSVLVNVYKIPENQIAKAGFSCTKNQVEAEALSEFPSFLWDTTGSGVYDNIAANKVIYTPSFDEWAQGKVKIKLFHFGHLQCKNVIDSQIVFLKAPDSPLINIYRDTLIAPEGFYIYRWYRNDSLLPGFSTNRIRVKIRGTYRLEVETEFDCKQSSAPYKFWFNGVDTYWTDDINIYPNPANEYIIVPEEFVGGELKLYTLDGKELYQKKIESITLNLGPRLIEGMYILRLQNNHNILTTRLILQQ